MLLFILCLVKAGKKFKKKYWNHTYSLRAQCGYKKPLEKVYEAKLETSKVSWTFWSHTCCSILKDIILKFSRIYECYNLFTCGEYTSSLKKCIFIVHPIFQCIVEKNSYSKTIILTEIFIIIRLLSTSNKVLKYFLNHTKNL